MRTVETLDTEAERLLRQAMRRRGQSFKEALNKAVLKGLADIEDDVEESPFEPESSPMRLLAGHDPGRLNQLGDELEAQAFVDLTVRLREQRGER